VTKRMACSRGEFLLGSIAFATLPGWGETAGKAGEAHLPWERADGAATDAVFCRRVYLDFAGRIPTGKEAREFAKNPDRAALVDRLLASEDFADYWSMRFADILRIKSEFPINLWPNAVYVYHRRVRDFVRNDEPWDAFARKLVTATGSDFRDAEVNFLRATADRSAEGLARVAVKTFLDEDLERWERKDRDFAVAAFSGVRFKSTREWKEELVYTEGDDGRGAFAAWLTGAQRARFAAAFEGRVFHWIFGCRRLEGRALGALALTCGLSLKTLCRAIAHSPEYARGSVRGGFPLRRLDAEVLSDALGELVGFPREYRSIAPEPFTFLPKGRKSVLIEDGSISSSFLSLFGRPPRDSGDLAERSNQVTAKQRLFLLNSGVIYDRLRRLKGDHANVYWRFLGRAPTPAERRIFTERKVSVRDLAWCIVNSREFLYRG